MSAQVIVPFFDTAPQFDRLPVYKLCCDETTPPNDRVFAQAQLCRTEDTLYARIWSFEPEPEPDVMLVCQLSKGHHLVSAAVSMGGDVSLVKDGESKPDSFTAHLFSGEDLQGEYNGVVMALPLCEIFETLAADKTFCDTKEAEVNILRIGTRQSSVSSLSPVGEPITVKL